MNTQKKELICMKTSAQLTALLCLPVLICSGLASANNATTVATTFVTTNDGNKKFDMHHPAVKSVLMSYYNASYEKLNDCFVTKHKTNAGTHAFCLIPKAEVKTINGNPTLFLLVYGEPLNTELARVTNGLGGLFTLSPLVDSSDIWRVTHSSPYIYHGQSGFSQLKNLSLTKIGANNYGWTGEIAYSGGGTSVTDWVMLAPVNQPNETDKTNDIKEVVNITTYYEYNMTGNRAKLSIIDKPNTNQPNQKWYPLLVEKITCNFEQPAKQNMDLNVSSNTSSTITTEIPQCASAAAVDSLYEYDETTNEYVEVFND